MSRQTSRLFCHRCRGIQCVRGRAGPVSRALSAGGCRGPGPGGRPRAAAAESRRPHLQGHDKLRARAAVHQPGPEPAYGFNHAEAGRAFAEAARLDPVCAMAYWGQALVLGPNINAAMAPDDEPKALALVQKAERREDASDAARAGVHRGAAAPATRARPRIDSRPIAPTPTRCARCSSARFRPTSTPRRCSPNR